MKSRAWSMPRSVSSRVMTRSAAPKSRATSSPTCSARSSTAVAAGEAERADVDAVLVRREVADPVFAVMLAEPEDVGAGAARQQVVHLAPDEPVVAVAAFEDVRAAAAAEPVVATTAAQQIELDPAGEPIVAVLARQHVAAEPALEPVGSPRSVEPVVRRAADQVVAAQPAAQDVAAAEPLEPVAGAEAQHARRSCRCRSAGRGRPSP